MRFFETCVNALSVYSRIPMPRVEWREDNSRLIYCFFPLVGVISGGLMCLWYFLIGLLGIDGLFSAIIFVLIPIAVSGGLHMDGFCDVSDAFASHQSREKMLTIMKDSHVGAFGVLSCICYLLLFTAAWSEVSLSWRAVGVAGISAVMSRSLSGLAAVTRKNARGQGMLAMFSNPADKKTVKLVLICWLALCAAGAIVISPLEGGAVTAGMGLSFIYYTVMTEKKFGGITGDLAGWFVQISELNSLLALMLCQKICAVI